MYDLIFDYKACAEKITKFYTKYRYEFLTLRKHGIDLIYILIILEPEIYNLKNDLDRILKNVDDSAFWFLVALMIGYSIRRREIIHDGGIREILEEISNEVTKPPSTPNTAIKLLDQIVAKYILGNKVEKALLEKIINNIDAFLVRIHWKILGLAWLYIILIELGISGEAFKKLELISSKLESELQLLDTSSIKSIDLTTLMKVIFAIFAFTGYTGPLIIIPARTFYLLNDKCLNLPEICLRFYTLVIKSVEKEIFIEKKDPLFLLLEEFKLADSLEKFLEGDQSSVRNAGMALEDVTEKVLALLGFRVIKLSGKGIYRENTDKLKQSTESVDIIAIDHENNIVFLINCTMSMKIDEDMTKTSEAMKILKPIVGSAYKVIPVIVTNHEFKDFLDIAKKRGITVLSLNIIKQAYELAKEGVIREAKQFLLQYMALPQTLEEAEQEEI